MSVVTEERTRRRLTASQGLSRQLPSKDVSSIVVRLDDGLSLLRNLLFTRLQADVRGKVGADSMLMPLSFAQTEHLAKGEIEAFAIAEIVEELPQAKLLPLAASDHRWLLDLRLGSWHDRAAVEKRLGTYRQLEARARQLEFSDELENILKEARHAPQILYQLFPLAVRVAAALAFGDHLRGGEIRNRQVSLLPAITYCRNCHGRLMEVDETCRECGNPLWTTRWLTQME